MSKLPSELRYCSILVYDKNKAAYKDFIIKVKSDAVGMFTYTDGERPDVKLHYRDVAAEYVSDALKSPECEWARQYLNPEVCLVPVPGSSPHLAGSLWATERLCHSLVAKGLGKTTELLVKRVSRVKKSAFCKSSDERPGPVTHYESVVAERKIIDAKDITIVDDVITRGATTLGVYQRVKESYPDKNIRVFSLSRTVSPTGDFIAPWHGTIKYFMGRPCCE